MGAECLAVQGPDYCHGQDCVTNAIGAGAIPAVIPAATAGAVAVIDCRV
jgi:hypothetical protein